MGSMEKSICRLPLIPWTQQDRDDEIHGTYVMHPEKRHDLYKRFAQMIDANDVADRGGDVRQIGRWPELAAAQGVVICESGDPAAL